MSRDIEEHPFGTDRDAVQSVNRRVGVELRRSAASGFDGFVNVGIVLVTAQPILARAARVEPFEAIVIDHADCELVGVHLHSPLCCSLIQHRYDTVVAYSCQ